MDIKEFCTTAIEQHPQLNDCDGEGVHYVMGRLADLIRTSLRSNEIEGASKVLNLVERVIQNPESDSEIENAVWITFLQIYEFENGGEFESESNLLPAKIKKCLELARGA